MTLDLITPTDLKNKLKLQGVDESLLSDDSVLQDWIDLKVDEIIDWTGLAIKPVTRKEILRRFKGDLFETNIYPVTSVNSFKINNVELTSDDYVLDENAGIFYLNHSHTGMLVIEYVHCVSQEFVTSKIDPLIVDMLLYTFNDTTGENSKGNISSIHEMDTTINYDTSNSLGNRIYARLESLKNYGACSSKVKWL